MAELLPLLDGARSRAQVLAAARDVAPGDLSGVLDALRGAGVLREAERAEAADALAAGRRRALAAARFVVSGHESWTAAAVKAFRDQGAQAARCAPGGAGQPDLLVSVAGEAPFELSCDVDAGAICIGPLGWPGKAGCWRCADLRRRANAPFADGAATPAADAERLVGLGAQLLAQAACEALCAAREAHRLARHMLAVDAATLSMSRHPVLPAPGCPVCGGPPATGERSGPVCRSDGEALLALADLVDTRVGVINCMVMESAGALGLERPVVATAVTACAPDGAEPPARMPVGWGKGMTPTAAALSAAGEALERYAASLPDARRIVRARMAELPAGEVVDPRDFPLFEARQYARPDFPFAPFDPDIAHPWVAGWRAGIGAPAWIPAMFCYLSFTYEPRQNFCSGTSNGLAAGAGVDDAALRAMLELVERDAFMVSWRTRRPGQPILVDEDWDPELLAVIRGVEALGGAVQVALLPSATGMAAALCLAFGDGVAWPGVTLGLGADPDARAAIRQAVLELGQTGPYLRRLMREGAKVPEGPEAVREMMDHAAYYFDPRRAGAFDYLRHGNGALSWRDLHHGPARSLEGCVAALEQAGIRMWLVDVTSADLAMTPFRVVRAVSPDLQPISFGAGLERGAIRRIAAEAVALPAAYVSPIW
jgi:ribosomal protein S12 methylthiotransferase accessory factor